MTTTSSHGISHRAVKRLQVGLFAALVAITVLWGGNTHTYGHPGSINGGVVSYGYGFELWGTVGFFKEDR